MTECCKTCRHRLRLIKYEICGTIRHALYLANGGDKNGWSTAAQEPLSESGLDMPKCEVREDETD